MSLPPRADVWALVCEWIQNDGLRKHVLSVEAAVRAYALKYGADEELWGAAALVHDLDYERFPDMDDALDGHPRTALRLFREWGWPEELIHAVAAHADFLGIPATTPLDKTLRACDEITGLIIATTYVRPSRDLGEVTLSSVKKKWKDRRFTAAIDRDEIAHNTAELGEDLDTHIQFVLEAMQGIAAELGLDGSEAPPAAR